MTAAARLKRAMVEKEYDRKRAHTNAFRNDVSGLVMKWHKRSLVIIEALIRAYPNKRSPGRAAIVSCHYAHVVCSQLVERAKLPCSPFRAV